MILAVTYENGMVFPHFGRTQQFKLFTVEDGAIVSSQIVDTEGKGHGALARFLAEKQVAVLLCGGIGESAQAALKLAGIRFFAGVSGSADEAAEAYLKGTLHFVPNMVCNHHHHGLGMHHCGEHGCGDE